MPTITVTKTETRAVTNSVNIVAEATRKGNIVFKANGVIIGGINKEGYIWRKLGADSSVTGLRHLEDGRVAFKASV